MTLKTYVSILALLLAGFLFSPFSVVSANDKEPSVPIPIAPAGAVSDSDVDFSWKGVDGVQLYRLVVESASDPSMLRKIDIGCEVSDCLYILPLPEGDYKWHVASLTEDEVRWSVWMTFSVEESDPWEQFHQYRWWLYGGMALVIIAYLVKKGTPAWHIDKETAAFSFLVFLLTLLVFFFIVQTMFPAYWHVDRVHVLRICPVSEAAQTRDADAIYPTLVEVRDQLSNKTIPLKQWVGVPNQSTSNTALQIDNCYFLRVKDINGEKESFSFRFAESESPMINVQVSSGRIVNDTVARRSAKTSDFSKPDNFLLSMPVIRHAGLFANLGSLAYFIAKWLGLLAFAYATAFLISHFCLRKPHLKVLFVKLLAYLLGLLVAGSLAVQLTDYLVGQTQMGTEHRFWVWAIEIELLLVILLLPLVALKKRLAQWLVDLANPLTLGQLLGVQLFALGFGALFSFAVFTYNKWVDFNLPIIIVVTLLLYWLLIKIASTKGLAPVDIDHQKPLIAWQRVLLYSLPVLIVSVFYWLVFWPGLFLTDTAYQFNQIYSGIYNNHHPIIHTGLLWLTTRFWPSQGAMVFVQIILHSATIGLLGWRMEHHRKPRWLIWLAISILLVNPGTAIMPTTVIKGSIHGIFVLLALIFLLEVYYSDGAWLKRPRNCLLLGLSIIFSAFFRHNGIYEFLPALLVGALVFKTFYRQFLIILLGVIVIYASTIALAGSIFTFNRGFDGFAIQTQFIYRAYLHQGVRLQDDSLELLSIFPKTTLEDMTNYYNSIRVGSSESKKFLRQEVLLRSKYEDETKNSVMANILLQEVLHEPMPLVYHIFYTSRTMWVPATTLINNDKMATPTQFENLYAMERYVKPYEELHEINSVFPGILAFVHKLTNQIDWLGDLIFRPGLYSLLLLFASIAYWIRDKFNPRALVVWIPLYLHFAFFAVFHLWSYSYRYHWAYIASIILLTANLLHTNSVAHRNTELPEDTGGKDGD